MIRKLDKRGRATFFRIRLKAAMQEAGETQAGLARRIGVNRSTVSQLLDEEGARLPNAQVVGECAAALGVSADWLLGLVRPEGAGGRPRRRPSMTLTEAPRALVDETIFAWHREAAGYKIRHVPAQLPDMLKTEEVLRWEYEPSLGRTIDQAIGASRDRLDWMRGARSDYEMAIPLHELQLLRPGRRATTTGCPPLSGARRSSIGAVSTRSSTRRCGSTSSTRASSIRRRSRSSGRCWRCSTSGATTSPSATRSGCRR